MLVKPSEAAMIVAVVEAMPFWVKVRLYGAAGPVRWFEQVVAYGHRQLVPADVLAAETEPVIGVQSLEVHQLVGHLVVVLQRVHQAKRAPPRAGWTD